MIEPLRKQPQASLRRERRTAAAGARGVRIDEVESLPHQRLFVVQRHAVQIEERLGIDEDAHAVELVDAVALAGLRVELDGIRKPRAAAAHHAQAQAALFGRNAFLGHGGADALDGAVGDLQALAAGACRPQAAAAELLLLRRASIRL